MIATIARCITGYVLACIVAGAIQVGFVLSPIELANAGSERLGPAGIWLILAALHSGLFAAPFAAVMIVVGERQGQRSAAFYAASGGSIATIGFLIQLLSTGLGQPAIVTLYVLTAFVAAGSAGGLVYWAVAGRRAGSAIRANHS